MKVSILAYPIVELTGEIDLPDGLTYDGVREYISRHPRELKYNFSPRSPRTVSFAGNDFWVDTIDGEKFRRWESFE